MNVETMLIHRATPKKQHERPGLEGFFISLIAFALIAFLGFRIVEAVRSEGNPFNSVIEKLINLK